MREAGRYQLLTPEEEVELAKRVEEGDAAAKERMINSNLRLVVSIARKQQGRGLEPARPDPGGDAGPDPRGREVRLAQGIPVLHLCDLVDPPGGRAQGSRTVAHDPDPGSGAGARAQGDACRPQPHDAPGPRATDEEIAEEAGLPLEPRAGGAARAARRDEPRCAGRRRRRRDSRLADRRGGRVAPESRSTSSCERRSCAARSRRCPILSGG